MPNGYTPCPKCNRPDTMYGIKCYNCGYVRDIKIPRDDKDTRIKNASIIHIRYRTTRKQAEMIFNNFFCGRAMWKYKSYLRYRRCWRKDRETLMSNIHGIVIGIEPDGYAHS